MMTKQIIIGILVFILLGAAAVAAYDSVQGNSSLELPDTSFLTNGQQAGSAGQGQGWGQQAGQGQGQGRGQRQGQGQGQGRGQNGSQGQGQGMKGQGQQQGMPGQGQGQGNGEPIEHEWVTLSGSVISVDTQGVWVDTPEQGEIMLNLGRPDFADEQDVDFSAGDAVTIQGFTSPQGIFVAGAITIDSTGQTLHLRDPNGRPLWAGQGRQGHGGQGGGQGQGRWQ